MRIAHIVYIPRLSGAEVLVSLLLPAHQSHGHHVCFASINPIETSFVPSCNRLADTGVSMFCPVTPLSRLGRLSFLHKSFKNFRPEIIFAHSIIPSAYARLAAIPLGAPVITVLHDASRDDYKSWLYRLAEHLLPEPRFVVAVADAALARYRERFSSRMPGQVIENAVDLAGLRQAAASRASFRTKVLGLSPSEKLLVSVGRYSSQKNQELLIHSFGAMSPAARAISRLLLVGISEDPNYEQHLRMIASEFGDRVLILSNRSDSHQILACADAFCMPSLHEGFSLAFLEGLALGISVLGSDIPAFWFARNWAGVTLIPVSDRTSWSAQMEVAVLEPATRYVRPLNKFDADTVASEYESVACRTVG